MLSYTNCQPNEIDAKIYFFQMTESREEFASKTLINKKQGSENSLQFDGLVSLIPNITNHNYLFMFKITIEFTLCNLSQSVKRFQMMPLECQHWSCNDNGICYVDYQRPSAPLCQCAEEYFGLHCQFHNPCSKKVSVCWLNFQGNFIIL